VAHSRSPHPGAVLHLLYEFALSNTRIERTIGAGILVKETRKLAPLAAERPC